MTTCNIVLFCFERILDAFGTSNSCSVCACVCMCVCVCVCVCEYPLTSKVDHTIFSQNKRHNHKKVLCWQPFHKIYKWKEVVLLYVSMIIQSTILILFHQTIFQTDTIVWGQSLYMLLHHYAHFRLRENKHEHALYFDL